TLERAKFTNWEIMKDAVRNRAMRVGGLQQIDIPSRSLFLLKSGFPAPKVTAAISLDGQRLELHSAVRERVTGLVDEQSHTFRIRLAFSGDIYFKRKDELLSLEELSRLIVSLANRF
ncbi:MAG: hypothetical protein WCC37_13110, partial [Candidatus Sulfotelmatobacter sp.]